MQSADILTRSSRKAKQLEGHISELKEQLSKALSESNSYLTSRNQFQYAKHSFEKTFLFLCSIFRTDLEKLQTQFDSLRIEKIKSDKNIEVVKQLEEELGNSRRKKKKI